MTIILCLWGYGIILPMLSPEIVFGLIKINLFGLEITSFGLLIAIICPIMILSAIFIGFRGFIGDVIRCGFHLFVIFFVFIPFALFQLTFHFAALEIDLSIGLWFVLIFAVLYRIIDFSLNTLENYNLGRVPIEKSTPDASKEVIKTEDIGEALVFQIPQIPVKQLLEATLVSDKGIEGKLIHMDRKKLHERKEGTGWFLKQKREKGEFNGQEFMNLRFDIDSDE